MSPASSLEDYYFVEVYRPSLVQKGNKGRICTRTHRGATFQVDDLSPGMTAVFKVKAVSGPEAAALTLEVAAGFPRSEVAIVYGGLPRHGLPPEG